MRPAAVMNVESWVSDWLWPFVRGDVPPRDFEQWAYLAPELEKSLSSELYLETISADYRDEGAVYALRKRLAQYARASFPLRCQCITLPDLADVPMGAHEDVL